MYVATRRIKVGDGWREPGDPVPEAAGWPNLKAHINCNLVKEVPDRVPVATDKPPLSVTAAAPASAKPTTPASARRR